VWLWRHFSALSYSLPLLRILALPVCNIPLCGGWINQTLLARPHYHGCDRDRQDCTDCRDLSSGDGTFLLLLLLLLLLSSPLASVSGYRAPPGAEEGDLLCVLYGVFTPFVLRRVVVVVVVVGCNDEDENGELEERRRFRLVGEAYLCSWFNGLSGDGVVSWGGVEGREFVLE